MTSTLLRKISPATVCKELPRLDIPGAPAEKVLYDVYGAVRGVKTGTTEKGEWLSFRGQFEAMTPDGEVFSSGAVFLPQPFEDMLYAQLQEVQAQDEKAAVEFAVRVSIVPPPKGKPSAVGYQYRVVPLIEAAQSSPIAALRDLVKAHTLKLAAPAPAENVKQISGKK